MTTHNFKHLPHLVALTGPKGSGKDTVADILVADLSYRKIAFADALRTEVDDYWPGVTIAMLTEPATKEHPITALAFERCMNPSFVDMVWRVMKFTREQMAAPRSPREIMQLWGTEFRRAQNPDYWVQRLTDEVALRNAEITTPDRWVITDCRFDNEVNMVNRARGQLWQVTRPGHGVQSGAHVSETTGAEFFPSVVLDNSGDLRALRHQVGAALCLQADRDIAARPAVLPAPRRGGVDIDAVHRQRDNIVHAEVREVKG